MTQPDLRRIWKWLGEVGYGEWSSKSPENQAAFDAFAEEQERLDAAEKRAAEVEELTRVLAGIDAGLQRIGENNCEEATRELSFAGSLLESFLPTKREEK